MAENTSTTIEVAAPERAQCIRVRHGYIKAGRDLPLGGDPLAMSTAYKMLDTLTGCTSTLLTDKEGNPVVRPGSWKDGGPWLDNEPTRLGGTMGKDAVRDPKAKKQKTVVENVTVAAHKAVTLVGEAIRQFSSQLGGEAWPEPPVGAVKTYVAERLTLAIRAAKATRDDNLANAQKMADIGKANKLPKGVMEQMLEPTMAAVAAAREELKARRAELKAEADKWLADHTDGRLHADVVEALKEEEAKQPAK